ncbi:MAG: hypothetical protein Q9163_006518 [Psora crenata]
MNRMKIAYMMDAWDLRELRNGIHEPKRAHSLPANSTDLNRNMPDQKSVASDGFYRYGLLERARIYIRPEPPPEFIQEQMDYIFMYEIPEGRRTEISVIAQMLSYDFIHTLRGSHTKDDLVELVCKALRQIDNEDFFIFPRKTAWNPSIKPEIAPNLWNWDALGQPNRAANIIDRPSSVPGPDDSRSNVLPLAAISVSRQDAVKTPRPDCTMGLRHSIISRALRERGMSRFIADDFLRFLQSEGKLHSDPTKDFLGLRFPNLVIEGKAYAIGKSAFEAQNQAAVSGACMVNLQQELTDLFRGFFPNPRPPLAFSICTEGAHIEFWVHYTLKEENVPCHYMSIFRTCYGSIRAELEGFLMDVERLMSWTKEDYLEDITAKLYHLSGLSYEAARAHRY